MRKPLQNIGASVRARLLNLAKERNQPFELLLVRYTLERLLYRLSTSKHRESFVLKGAMLMRHWLDDPHRPTRDLDLLGFGKGDPELTLKIFREICAIKADDAVIFDVKGLIVDQVREDSGYSGLRLKTYATVDGARVRVVIDGRCRPSDIGKNLRTNLSPQPIGGLFQPLLYQVATAALSPGDIGWPIRSIFAKQKNVRVGTIRQHLAMRLNDSRWYTRRASNE
jgi:hypothetical protein